MEITELNIMDDGTAVKQIKDKTLLIDADTLAFTACLAAQKEVELLPRDFYTEEEWNDLHKTAVFKDDSTILTSDFNECISFALSKLKKIQELTGCLDYMLFFTTGKSSFRYKIYPEYKANRKYFIPPLHLQELKEFLCGYSKRGYLCDEIEADDAVAYLYRQNPEKYIIVAVDKDVLNALEGTHFCYYESAVHDISMQWKTTDAETARLFPYRQALMGDRSDNIIGIRGVGEARAKKIIPDGTMHPIAIVRDQFHNAGMTVEDADLNVELCYMGAPEHCKDYLERLLNTLEDDNELQAK